MNKELSKEAISEILEIEEGIQDWEKLKKDIKSGIRRKKVDRIIRQMKDDIIFLKG